MALSVRSFQIGSLVKARGREWVVLPSEDPEVLRVRPLGGTDEDAQGIYLPLERNDVTPAALPPPDPKYAGNAVAASLLRDAARRGFRAAAGPLRSVARIAVEPRPYQLVPLLMALRLNPVRLLIGDDVGIGKTIEAALIARELLDRGEIRRLTVLCPPHLCDQWVGELREKFHLDAVEVRPGTVSRLERDIPPDRSIFSEYPVTVVSIDFIKGDRRRAQFVQTCPELVIVDEAHADAQASGKGAQQQRHSLLRDLATDPRRHLVLATATPHSGDEGAFASLIGLLDPEIEAVVARGGYGSGTEARSRLARHFVQRRRADVDGYLGTTTDFPARESSEQAYQLGAPYKVLLSQVRDYTRELVRSGEGLSRFQQRVRWWAALALLRCVSSSPAAAVLALRTRAARPAIEDVAEADRLGQDAVFDVAARDEAEGDDSTPGADTVSNDDETSADTGDRRRLNELARAAEDLAGAADPKLRLAERIVTNLLRDGFRPIVFCRYIATAEYVGAELQKRLGKTTVAVVTGTLPPEERARAVSELTTAPRRVLVATDCLSEGINLQAWFDAVVHYDLAWNPTRHEQREGRVDRYGQPSRIVRTALIYGKDNPVDEIVLRVLLRKAMTIRRNLGVSVPVPLDTDAIVEEMFAEVFRRQTPGEQLPLFVTEEEHRVDQAWDAAAAREERTRTIFAQHGIRAEEIQPELRAVGEALGTSEDVRRFVQEAGTGLGATLERLNGVWRLDPRGLPKPVRARVELIDVDRPVEIGFALPIHDGATYVPRTHPLVEALAGYVLDTAIAEPEKSLARRCAAIRTRAVTYRTVLLLLRGRYLLEEAREGRGFPMLAEECFLSGFEDAPNERRLLADEETRRLAQAEPSANLQPGEAVHHLSQILGQKNDFQALLDQVAQTRAEATLDAHRRVRAAARLTGVRYRIAATPELDLLGVYLLLPSPTLGSVRRTG
jgi:superfamily II DNA or RNA helicase